MFESQLVLPSLFSLLSKLGLLMGFLALTMAPGSVTQPLPVCRLWALPLCGCSYTDL